MNSPCLGNEVLVFLRIARCFGLGFVGAALSSTKLNALIVLSPNGLMAPILNQILLPLHHAPLIKRMMICADPHARSSEMQYIKC